jgi:hypothetical protein
MPEPIREQVLDDLFEPVRVGNDLISCWRNVDMHRDGSPLDFRLMATNHVFKYPAGSEHATSQVGDSILESRKIDEISHDPVQPDGFMLQRGQIAFPRVAIECDILSPERFRVSAHCGQRCFQLM